MPPPCSFFKLFGFFGINDSPAYNKYTLRIKDKDLFEKFVSRKRLQVYQNHKLIIIGQFLLNVFLVVNIIQIGYPIRLLNFFIYIPKVLLLVIYSKRPQVCDYIPHIWLALKYAMQIYFQQYLLVNQGNTIENKYPVVFNLFWLFLIHMVYINYLSVSWLASTLFGVPVTCIGSYLIKI